MRLQKVIGGTLLLIFFISCSTSKVANVPKEINWWDRPAIERVPAGGQDPFTISCFQYFKYIVVDKEIQGEKTVLSIPNILEKLHLTQFHFGLPRVLMLQKMFKTMDTQALNEFFATKPIPFVRGPDGRMWMIDRHHYIRAIFGNISDFQSRGINIDDLNIHFVEVENFSSASSIDEFFDLMTEKKLVFPFMYGVHRQPRELPIDPMLLRDEYFRGLAWLVREADGFEKSGVPFAEFYWGEFLREILQLDERQMIWSSDVVKEALKKVLHISEETINLPGFKGYSYIQPSRFRKLFLDDGNPLTKDEIESILKNVIKKKSRKDLRKRFLSNFDKYSWPKTKKDIKEILNQYMTPDQRKEFNQELFGNKSQVKPSKIYEFYHAKVEAGELPEELLSELTPKPATYSKEEIVRLYEEQFLSLREFELDWMVSRISEPLELLNNSPN